nr:uncharacterized protein LOC127322164 [Lolium perenne]
MDVVFREQEPFYGESTDLTDVFPDLVTNDISDADCEIGGDKDEENNDTTLRKVIIGAIPVGDEIEQGQIQREEQDIQNEAPQWPRPNEQREIQVYKRRHIIEEQHVQGEETTSSGHDSEAQEESEMDSTSTLDAAQPIPHNWQEAKMHPHWREAMLEEMAALDKNNTWVIMRRRYNV